MEVIKISPRGYCYGVVDAMQVAKAVAEDPKYPRPIYVLGLIVHNRHAVQSLEEYGVITLDGPDRLSLLDQVESGTVIFTAHGVSPEVKRRALAKGLTCVDATCPDVTRTHHLVKELGFPRLSHLVCRQTRPPRTRRRHRRGSRPRSFDREARRRRSA